MFFLVSHYVFLKQRPHNGKTDKVISYFLHINNDSPPILQQHTNKPPQPPQPPRSQPENTTHTTNSMADYDYSRDVDVNEDSSSKKRAYEGNDYGREPKRDRPSNNRNRQSSKKDIIYHLRLGLCRRQFLYIFRSSKLVYSCGIYSQYFKYF